MFSSSRQGGFIYVLSKGERPTVKIGQIESVSSPVPKYPTYNPSVPYSPQPEMLIDIKVRCGEEVLDFQKLPANGEMFAYPNVIVSEKKEAIISEVEAMMQTSKQIVESVSYHNSVIESCDSILKELNPQFAKEKQQEDRINSLEQEVKSVKDGLGDIKSLLIEMNTSNKPKTTNSK
jgi:hypothetical protein